MENTIPEQFFYTAKNFEEKTALLYKKEGVFFPVSYREISDQVSSFAFVLQDIFKIRQSDKVSILSENRPEWLISDLAIMSLGSVTVPLHTTLNGEAILNILKHSDSKVLIVSDINLLNKALSSTDDFKFLEGIIIFEKMPVVKKIGFYPKIYEWQDLVSKNKGNIFKKAEIKPDDPCTIIYTSGTTGDPKGVVLSHRNFLSNVESINNAIPVKENDVFLSFLPLSHALERTAGQFAPIFFGSTIAYAQSPKTLPADLKKIRPSILISVPKIFEKFHDAIWDKVNKSSKINISIFKWALKQDRSTMKYKIADFLVFKKIRKSMGGNLRLAISGGAKLNENLVKFFLKIGIIILEGYGLTETSPVVSVVTQEDMAKFGKIGVGKAILNVKIKISKDKEILIKGPNVFSEYYKNPEFTHNSFDKDGWFCSGDLGFIDKNGFLTVIGRRKEMIALSGGKNVWPEVIEILLNGDKFISQSMVLANNRNFVSALICPDWKELEIFLKENNLPMQSHNDLVKNSAVLDIFKKRIDQKINPKVNDYEQIKKFFLVPEEFSQEREELTPTLKLRRHIIMRHYDKLIKNI